MTKLSEITQALVRSLAKPLFIAAVALLGAQPAAAKAWDEVPAPSCPVEASAADSAAVEANASVEGAVASRGETAQPAAPAPQVALNIELLEVEPGVLSDADGNVGGAAAGADLAARLASLKARGLVKTLSEPRYVTRSDETLTLNIVGEPPRHAEGGVTRGAPSYGVSLVLSPSAQSDGAIRLTIESRGRGPGETAAPSAPTTTAVNLENGGSALLGGLADIRDVRPSAKSGLFAKFSLLNRLAGRAAEPPAKELLVLVSPRLVKPPGLQAQAEPAPSVTRVNLVEPAARTSSLALVSAPQPAPRTAPGARLASWLSVPLHRVQAAARYVRLRLMGPPDRMLAMR